MALSSALPAAVASTVAARRVLPGLDSPEVVCKRSHRHPASPKSGPSLDPWFCSHSAIAVVALSEAWLPDLSTRRGTQLEGHCVAGAAVSRAGLGRIVTVATPALHLRASSNRTITSKGLLSCYADQDVTHARDLVNQGQQCQHSNESFPYTAEGLVQVFCDLLGDLVMLRKVRGQVHLESSGCIRILS